MAQSSKDHQPDSTHKLRLETAFSAGMTAAEKNESRAPILNRTVMRMVDGKHRPSEGEVTDIYLAFTRGYQAFCDDEVDKALS